MSTAQQPDNKDRPARLTVGVVGAGRVGPTLAVSLQLAGHRPVAVSGVSDASRRRAAQMLPDVPIVTPADVLQRADLVLLTVPDDTLPGLVEGLAETGAVRPGQLLVHTSGRYGAKVLDPALRAGALPLALHPAMTFTGTAVDVQRLAGQFLTLSEVLLQRAPEEWSPPALTRAATVGGGWQKQSDTRQIMVTVEGPDFAWLFTVTPTGNMLAKMQAQQAREFAVAATLAGRVAEQAQA